MLTNLTFKMNDNPSGKQRIMEEHPNTFIVVPNLENEIWKGVKISEDDVFTAITEIEPGVYEGGWNPVYEIDDYSDYNVFPKSYRQFFDSVTGKIGDSDTDNHDNYTSMYGVADNLDQIKEYFKTIIDSDQEFVITTHTLQKKYQSEEGGWRWHKWGEYIGTQEPKCEYLYDEPVIEEVIVFHGFGIKKK